MMVHDVMQLTGFHGSLFRKILAIYSTRVLEYIPAWGTFGIPIVIILRMLHQYLSCSIIYHVR